MKKITLIALFLCLGIFYAQAGNGYGQPLNTPAAVENNYRNALWFNSQNRAGLAFSPMYEYNDLDLNYGMKQGDFRPQTVGRSEHSVNLNTSGAVMLGKFMLWGDFSFRNRFEKEACYNTMLYDVEEDMPYFIMDKYVSNWNKQEYDLGASLTSPVVAGRISFGLKLHYLTKVGAKQKDPRSETYKYNIEVVPSIAIDLGKNNTLGISGLFDNNFERSKPSLNNYMESPKIVYNKGLGEGIIGKVGGNDGLKTIFYKGMKYGGGLQYAYDKETSLLVDLGYIARKIDGFEHPGLPKRLGSTSSGDIYGNLQVAFGKEKSNKFTLKGLFSMTDGIEHIQKLNTEAFNQRWEVVSSNNMTDFTRIQAGLEYDHLFGNEVSRGWNWKVGGRASFTHRSYVYNIPRSTFTATSALLGLNGGKQLKFRNSTLHIGLDCAYNLALGGDYLYGGNKRQSLQVAYYQLENQFMTTDFVQAGAQASYIIHAKKVNYFIDLRSSWTKAMSIAQDRWVNLASIGIVF